MTRFDATALNRLCQWIAGEDAAEIDYHGMKPVNIDERSERSGGRVKTAAKNGKIYGMNATTSKTVITYGTFDLFHIGHLRLLERAKALAGAEGKLIVAVSTDRFNEIEKGKHCSISDHDRMEIVAALRCVDQVIPEDNWEQKKADVAKYGVDVFVMGDDWKGKFDFLKEQCEVVYLPRTPDVSSTEIKNQIRS